MKILHFELTIQNKDTLYLAYNILILIGRNFG